MSPTYVCAATRATTEHIAPEVALKMTTRREQVKQELLEHYATREPHAFYQYDGDQGGDELEMTLTHELMYPSPVRVLIAADTSAADAVRLLKNIRRWIQRDGLDKDQLAAREAKLDAELCPRCGAEMPGQQGDHHRLCRNEDGSLTGLSDEAVREAIRLLKADRIDDIPF